MGRHSEYNEKTADTILERISNGESLKKITDEDGMPSRVTVHQWLKDNATFLNNYELARALQADVYADEMDEIAHNEKIDVQRARLIIDTRKWIASKLKPKKYGEKLDLTSGDEPISNALFAPPKNEHEALLMQKVINGATITVTPKVAKVSKRSVKGNSKKQK